MQEAIHSTQRQMAIVSAVSLFLMAAIAAVGYGYFFGNLFFPDSETATVLKVTKSPHLIRYMMISFVVILLLDVVVAWGLFAYFKPGNPSLALLAALLRIVAAAVLGAALLPISELLHLSATNPMHQSLFMAKFQTFLSVWSISLIFFGFHLLGIGWIVFKCAEMPRFIGWTALFAGICYIAIHILSIVWPLSPQLSSIVEKILALPMALGELLLAFWLILKGGVVRVNDR